MEILSKENVCIVAPLISGSYKVTSNFVTHMKRKHRDLYILHSENKEIQPTLTQCIKKSVKYSPSDPKQLEMTNALIMFIAGDLLPLSIVESEEFKNFSVSSEMDDYLSDNCIDMSKDPLLYWHSNCQRLPRLAKLAVQYLAIPATSAPVERLFSTAGKTFRPERCRLADGTFEKLMMVKCNGKMLK
ncbi:unnamed protein product [Mytilus edulis]|uniref:HAT C-terminal dimerisation domain-containing protein n=1 Tax=Mytilus edulis TaxID=6550 RepID=A0A8S3QEC8_MYTED|nr:unnamed protein product [Mytilus edulis]